MKDNPRYAKVVAQASGPASAARPFAQGLQRAGYATDPAYAAKLTRVINTDACSVASRAAGSDHDMRSHDRC